MIYDVIIVGGGASGLFAAANIDKNIKTLILEKTGKFGTKLLMSGSGQCNITNTLSIKEFVNKYNNPSFVRKIIYEFNSIKLIEYFESKGLKLMVRDDGKVFPESLRAKDILNLFIEEIEKKGHEFKLNVSVDAIKWNETFKFFTVKTEKESYTCRKLVLATGGKSYPKTGSDGSIFRALIQLGIEITPLKPSLTSIEVFDYKYSDISGVSIKNASVNIIKKDKKAINGKGDLLFTHTELSGPLILNNSRNMEAGDEIIIDFITNIKRNSLEKIFAGYIKKNPRRTIKTMLVDTLDLPSRFIEKILEQDKINNNIIIAEISKKHINSIVSNLKEHKFKIKNVSGFEKAMVTSGGVSTDEIDNKSMAWLKNKNIFFIGEMIDIDGETGGYNLQFAFSSAKKCILSLLFD
jgi:predicted Rossmann fold flavoprotein